MYNVHTKVARSLEFSFSSLWQTFFKFVLASGPQPPGCRPEASTHSKKSAEGN